MASRKKKYKKVFKGVRYITNAIRKKYPKKYTKAESSALARDLVKQLKYEKLDVTASRAFELIPKQKRKKKGDPPILSDKLAEAVPYYELIDYQKQIPLMPLQPSLTFDSKLVPIGLPPMRSGVKFSYKEYFEPFVKYVDELRKLSDLQSTPEDWWVMITEPVFDRNRDDDGWYSRIICGRMDVNEKGESYFVEMDYGFDQKNTDFTPNDLPDYEEIESKKKKSKSKKTEDATSEKKDDKTAEIALEKEKQKTKTLEIKVETEKQRTLLMELLKDKAIDKKYFMEEMKRLNNK